MADYDSDKLCESAAEALKAWNLKAEGIAMVSMSENIVFRVDTSGGAFALRFHRPGYHTLAELNSEIALHEMVRSAGMEAPHAVKTASGDYYTQIEIPTLGETRHVGLSKWINGVVLEDLIEESPDIAVRRGAYRRLGRLIATMHEYTARWTPPANFTRHALDADGFTGENPCWGRFWEAKPASPEQRRELTIARDRLRRFLISLDKGAESFGVIHADLHPGNVMVDDDHVIVFDFDDAAYGWYLYDIATSVFDAWLYDDDFDATYEALIEGYRQLRDFTDAMREQVQIFLLARLLAYVGWRDARPEYGESEFLPGLVELACERVREHSFRLSSPELKQPRS